MPRVRAIIPDPGTYYGLARQRGQRRPYHVPEVDVTHTFADAIAAAIALDHPCTDDPTCDVAAALQAGFPRVAADRLLSATEAENLANVIGYFVRCRGEEWDAYGAVGPIADDERAQWAQYFALHAVPCESCGAFTFGDHGWTPDTCGACGADLWADVIADAVDAYITAALWAGLNWPDGDENPEPLDASYSAADLTTWAREDVAADVGAFVREWWPLARSAGWTPGGFGHDYYLTRNHHGAGFWDRDAATLPGFPPPSADVAAVGRQLTEAAHREGEAELIPDGAGNLDYSRLTY